MGKRAKGDPIVAVRQYVKPGHRVVDVGANTGRIAEVMAMTVGPTGSVIAIEPHPGCAASINALAHRFPSFWVVQAAAWDHTGVAQLWDDDKDSCHASLCKEAVWKNLAAVPYTVETVTLDRLIKSSIDFVKMDAQGAECRILSGASRLLAQCPVWFIECWPWGLMQHGGSWQELWKTLRDAGFTLTYQSGEALEDDWFAEWVEEAPQTRFINICAVRA